MRVVNSVMQLAATNLTSPAVIAFAIGAAATLFRSNLRLPTFIYTAITTYLLFAIGLKGGAELSAASPSAIWAPALAGILLSCAIPLWVFPTAKYLGKFNMDDAAALAAHYGSVSVVTFTAALAFLKSANEPVEGYLPALLAIMEVPGILVALFIAGRSGQGGGSWGHALKEVLAGRSVLLLIGGLIAGTLIGKGGLDAVSPVMVSPFYPVLVGFLLVMGITAAQRFGDLKKAGLFLIAFGTGFAVLNGFIGALLGSLVGLSIGGTAVLATLAASASYIAAPAAVRIALPKANPGYYVTASLVITFPFNLLAGIPLYYQFARWLS